MRSLCKKTIDEFSPPVVVRHLERLRLAAAPVLRRHAASTAVAGSAASSGQRFSGLRQPSAATSATPPATVDNSGPAYGPELQGFNYPAPVEQYDFTSQGVALHMAYMDIKPEHANGRTAVLLHGKNFCAATWDATIHRLSDAGYRVIAPDQIGFCKSSKPEHYQYSFQQLARNTHALLESLGVTDATDDRPFDRRHARDPLCADVSA